MAKMQVLIHPEASAMMTFYPPNILKFLNIPLKSIEID